MRRRATTWIAAGSALLLLAAGCGSGGESRPGVEVRRVATEGGDSVTVVESPAPARAEGEGWSVVDTPSVAIGAGDGPGQALSDVAGAARLSDGRIVVANGQPPELRWFGPDGALIRRVGGEGEGPGEFLQITDFHRTGPDSLLVLDFDALRISVFDDTGGYRGSLSLREVIAGGDRPLYVFGIAATVPGRGRLLSPGHVGRDAPEGTVYFDSMPAPVLGPGGSVVDSLAHFRAEMYSSPGGRGRALPFGRVTRTAGGPDGVWVGDGTAAEATLLAPSGDPVRVLRWGYERPPARSRIEAVRERRLEGAGPEERQRIRKRLGEQPLPDRVPAYSQLVVDAGGRLWAERYRRRDYRGPTRWDVVDPEEGWLGTVEVPRNLDVQQIDEDGILGLWRDELDVENVGLFELRKAGVEAG